MEQVFPVKHEIEYASPPGPALPGEVVEERLSELQNANINGEQVRILLAINAPVLIGGVPESFAQNCFANSAAWWDVRPVVNGQETSAILAVAATAEGSDFHFIFAGNAELIRNIHFMSVGFVAEDEEYQDGTRIVKRARLTGFRFADSFFSVQRFSPTKQRARRVLAAGSR